MAYLLSTHDKRENNPKRNIENADHDCRFLLEVKKAFRAVKFPGYSRNGPAGQLMR